MYICVCIYIYIYIYTYTYHTFAREGRRSTACHRAGPVGLGPDRSSGTRAIIIIIIIMIIDDFGCSYSIPRRRAPRLTSPPRRVYIPQRGVQWKQGVVIYMMLYISLLYNTTRIRCTPLPLHPTVMNIRMGAWRMPRPVARALPECPPAGPSKHIYIYIYTYIYTCILYVYIYIYIYVYIYMYICIYVYMYIKLDKSGGTACLTLLV